MGSKEKQFAPNRDSAGKIKPDYTTREICKACFEINRVGFSVPDHVWKIVVPRDLQNHVLCLNCFTRFADEVRIEWDKDIKFFPVSLVTAVKG